jgi:hypothetical protein
MLRSDYRLDPPLVAGFKDGGGVIVPGYLEFTECHQFTEWRECHSCHYITREQAYSGNEIGMAENGGEARSSFIEKLKGILYTVSQFLSSLKQYILYVCVGKHMCYLLI